MRFRDNSDVDHGLKTTGGIYISSLVCKYVCLSVGPSSKRFEKMKNEVS